MNNFRKNEWRDQFQDTKLFKTRILKSDYKWSIVEHRDKNQRKEQFQVSIKTVLMFNAYTWILTRRTRLRNDIFKEINRVRRKQLQCFGRIKGVDRTRILKSTLERDLWDNPEQDDSTGY
jgi:hypothetical protein